MAVTSESEDWATLPPDLREQLIRFLPLDAKDLLSSPNQPSVHDLRRIQSHLKHLWNALSAMVPRWVIDSIDSSDSKQVRASQATLLFADVTGFTPLTAQLEAFGRIGNEYITSALNRFFAAVVPIALARNGDLLAFGGDAILVAFTGADNAAKAAVAAWEMQEAMESLDLRDIGLPNPPHLQMKIGLARGPLVLVSVGKGNRRIALPLGTVLDTTDAMANATMPGQIRLDAHAAAGAIRIAHLLPQSDGSALLGGLQDRPPLSSRPTSVIGESFDSLVAGISALANYLPQSVVASLIAAPQATPGYGEQRYVVNLFAHLAGLHVLADLVWSSEPHLVARAADLVLSQAIDTIEGHGGALARVDIYPEGHKLLALFGAPVAHEQQAARAILAALALRDAMPQLNTEVAALFAEHRNDAASTLLTNHAALRLRGGINAGPVVAGLVGSPLRWEYTVMGDAVNVSARLMSKAHPGEVLTGSSVSNTTEELVDGEARSLLLKGKPEPVPVVSVQRLRLADRSSQYRNVSLVGRESEREAIRDLGTALRAGQPRVMFVVGEAGIGKTRLVQEVPILLGPGVTCIQTGSPSLVPVSFGVIRTLLRELCREALGSSTPLDNIQLPIAVERLCPGQSAELWPALAVLLGIANANSTGFGETTETQHRIMAWAVKSVLEGAAARGSIAWISEDLHEADDASLAVLVQLLTLGWHEPVLLCATLRTTAATNHTVPRLLESASRGLPSNTTTIELAGLSTDAGSRLLDLLLPGVAPQTREELHAHAAGNPLFLQVLAQTVQQRRMLIASSQGLVLRGSLTSLDIPRTLRELVAAQVDRLPVEVRRLAQLAAVVAVADRTISLWLLEEIAEERQAVAARMRALEQAQVIEKEEPEPAIHYTFRHALYQQAAYDQLLERERRELHRRAGLVLQDHRDRQETRVEALAYHCYEGQLWELAADYSLEAGQRALRAYANRDARRYLRRALGLARRLGRAEQEADAREGLGELYSLVGRFLAAQAQLERAFQYSQTIDDRETLKIYDDSSTQLEAKLRRYRLLAEIAESMGEYDRAEKESRSGIALAHNFPSNIREMGRLHEQLAIVLMRRGQIDAAEQVCKDGLALLPTDITVAQERVALLHLIGHFNSLHGNNSSAIEVLEQCLTVVRQLNSPPLAAPILRNLGVAYYWMGQRSQAQACYKESLSIDERIGNIAGIIIANDNLGLVYLLNGDYPVARNCFQIALRLAEEHNMVQRMANVLVNLGFLCYVTGDVAEAELLLLRAHELFSDLGEAHSLADCLYQLGDVSLARGKPKIAYSYGEQTVMRAREVGSSLYEAYGMRVIGEALLAQGRLAESTKALSSAREVQACVDDAIGQVLLLRAMAMLTFAQGESEQAQQLVQAGMDLASAQEVPYLVVAMQDIHMIIESRATDTV
jgi:class 3 adenylate cyclase/tetratricopeptide (TPR) repeat protein